jgi:1-acyl-sn-glycerol-3-phosphate acyltransferase
MLSRIWKKIKRWRESPEKEITEFIEYRETRLAKWSYSLIKKIFGPIVRKIWVHEIEGLENIPKKGPVIVVSNHESYFDFICFIAASPRKVHYLAAEKFYKSRLWRPLMHLTSQIKVDRIAKDKSGVHQLVFSALKQERMIGIFPEGTRNRVSDGKLQKAFVGTAKYALKVKVPVLPVGVIGSYDIMSAHDKFPRLNKKAKIRIGELMHFHEYHDIEHTEEHFREVTDKIMLRIAELSEKEYPHIENPKLLTKKNK